VQHPVSTLGLDRFLVKRIQCSLTDHGCRSCGGLTFFVSLRKYWTIVQYSRCSMGEIVETERIGHVLRITLNRPKVNAISRALSRALHAAAVQLHSDPELRVGIITAKGDRVFCAGWDFVEATQDPDTAKTESGDISSHGAGGFGGITQYWDLKK